MVKANATSSYGQSRRAIREIREVIAGNRSPRQVRTVPGRRRLHLDCIAGVYQINVVDWGKMIVNNYGHSSVMLTPDRRDYTIQTPEAVEICRRYQQAHRNQLDAWHLRTDALHDDQLDGNWGPSEHESQARMDQAVADAKALVEAMYPSTSTWEY